MSQKVTLEELSSEIRRRGNDGGHVVVALCGFGGAGKSTAANALSASLGDAAVVHLDDFIVDRLSARSTDWDGFDWNRLVQEVLQPVAGGADAIEYGAYDWEANGIREKKKVILPKYLIVEGVGLIRDELKNFFTVTVWIDVPLEVANERGKRRDVEEYGATKHASLWDTVWTPNDKDYFAKYRPDETADYLLEN